MFCICVGLPVGRLRWSVNVVDVFVCRRSAFAGSGLGVPGFLFVEAV